MLIGPLLLALLGLLIGLFPTSIAETLISPALSAILGEPESVDLALWHGVNLMLILSVVTVASGVAIYAARDLFCRLGALFDGIAQWGPERWYFLSLDGLNTLASALARLIQRASLGSYLLITILTTAGLAGFTLLSQIDLNSLFTMPDARFSEWVLAGLILSAAFLAVRTSSFLTAVIALGVVGLGMTLIFILFGAPDLAMTQFAVDTLSVILFVLVIYRLPDYKSFSSMPARIRDALVALIAGGFMTLLTLAITSQPLRSLLTPYFAENSVTLAKGRNVVNVILVDFRALDTLGEITVLAMAAIGVYALMKLRPPKKDDP
jgi:multicomponent Na+:H+ antiporter subunit A